MVHVPADGVGLAGNPALQLDDFLIGKYEVTNREYKIFVDAAGDRNAIFCKFSFAKDGRTLSFEQAMRLTASIMKAVGVNTVSSLRSAPGYRSRCGLREGVVCFFRPDPLSLQSIEREFPTGRSRGVIQKGAKLRAILVPC